MHKHMVDVTTIGSATYDIFLKSPAFQIVSISRFPSGKGECLAYGTKIPIEHMDVSSGGGATNVAASLKHFGFSVQVVAKVGNDVHGDLVIDDLRARRIPTIFIQRDRKHHTALAVILMGASSDRTILVYRGAAENLRPSEIPWDRMHSPWLYVSSLGQAPGLLQRVFRHARERGCLVMWNPGSHELQLGRSRLATFLKQSTILVLNEEEARKLTGKLTASRESLLDALDAASPGVNVMTGGKFGAWVSNNGKRFHAHGLSVKVANATGAGDAFSGGFLAAYIKTRNVEVSTRVGILNSASVIQISGAKAGLLSKFPSRQQLRKVKVTSLV